MANATRPAPRLSADAIAAVEHILNTGNRVELMPTEENGVRVFEIVRKETSEKRRLTRTARA